MNKSRVRNKVTLQIIQEKDILLDLIVVQEFPRLRKRVIVNLNRNKVNNSPRRQGRVKDAHVA